MSGNVLADVARLWRTASLATGLPRDVDIFLRDIFVPLSNSVWTGEMLAESVFADLVFRFDSLLAVANIGDRNLMQCRRQVQL